MKTIVEARSLYAAELVKLLKGLPQEERQQSMVECLSLLEESGREPDVEIEDQSPEQFAERLFQDPEVSPLLQHAISLGQTPAGCLSPDELVQRLLD
jgi:hypothetical protein